MRRRKADKRTIKPDLRYNDELIAKFINMVMWDGDKTKAQKIVYSALELVQKQVKEDNVVDAFRKIIDIVRPKLEVRSRRVGGATYQVPVEIDKRRSQTLALRWVRDYARSRKGQPMDKKLAAELIDAYNNQGASIKKRDDTHKMAEANRAFAHFRW